MPHLPRLLVSVRNLHEAGIARRAGADLLDLKEPSRGPLGAADPQILNAILQSVHDIPVSVAAGEAADWTGTESKQISPRANGGGCRLPEYFKLGLSRLAGHSDWKRQWDAAFRRAERHYGFPPCRRIAVVYADHRGARAPAPEEIITAAAEVGCAGVLVDTYDKSGPGLTAIWSAAEIRNFISEVQSRQMLAALAGKLTSHDLRELASLQPDILGVRSAACTGQDRGGTLDAEAVRRLKQEMRADAQRRPAAPCGGSE